MIKRNTNVKNLKSSRRLLIGAAVVLVGGGLACWGLSYGFSALRDVWLEQFRVQDTAIDIVVTYSPRLKDPDEEKSKIDIIKHILGLTNGVNLATIPYEENRAKVLKRCSYIQDIVIERRLPRRVTVHAKEREPAVFIAPLKSKARTKLVADYEGVVFLNTNGSSLPTIREADETRCKEGQRLVGHAYAADAAPELAELRVREIDTSKKDYLLVTFSDSSTAEIAWDHMGENSENALQSLQRQLRHLAQAMATRLKPPATRWIVTEYEKGGRVYAADPARLGER